MRSARGWQRVHHRAATRPPREIEALAPPPRGQEGAAPPLLSRCPGEGRRQRRGRCDRRFTGKRRAAGAGRGPRGRPRVGRVQGGQGCGLRGCLGALRRRAGGRAAGREAGPGPTRERAGLASRWRRGERSEQGPSAGWGCASGEPSHKTRPGSKNKVL